MLNADDPLVSQMAGHARGRVVLVGQAAEAQVRAEEIRLDANGRPQGIILSGPYLSDPQLIAVGYALEQALNGRVEPDLDATVAQIDAVTGK